MMKAEKKNILKHSLVTAGIISPGLAVMLISALYYFGMSAFTIKGSTASAVIMSLAALIAMLASSLLALIYEKDSVSLFLAFIWLLCSVNYLILYITGTTDVFSDGFFEMLSLIFYLPVYSYMSLLEAFPSLSLTAKNIIVISVALFFTVLNICVYLILFVEKLRAANVRKKSNADQNKA